MLGFIKKLFTSRSTSDTEVIESVPIKHDSVFDNIELDDSGLRDDITISKITNSEIDEINKELS
jgi:hypothetical protein